MEEDVHQLFKEIRTIRDEVIYIRRHMPDREMFLTAEEKRLLEESFVNERRTMLTGAALRKKLRL